MHITLAELANKFEAKLINGNPNELITGLASLADAQNTDASFLSDSRYRNMLKSSQAGVVLVDFGFTPKQEEQNKAYLALNNPSKAFAELIKEFVPQRPSTPLGVIHPSAVIHDEAQISANASLGAYSVVEKGAVIGERAIIGAHCFIGENSVIGEDTQLFPSVVVADGCEIGKKCLIHSGTVIGADGFGYEFEQGKHVKIPQLGNVVIEDKVEIGANSCVDRARFGSTRIGLGTKIDNLVQIGHNCSLGKHNIVCGQTGMAGSSITGEYTTMAAQSGLAGHLSIAAQTTVAARGGVINHISESGRTFAGFPAQDHANWRKQIVSNARLPKMRSELKELKEQVALLREQLERIS